MSNCSFHTGLRVRLRIDDVHVCSPSTVNTANGSGRLSNSLFARPLALKTVRVQGEEEKQSVQVKPSNVRLTLNTLSGSSDNLIQDLRLGQIDSQALSQMNTNRLELARAMNGQQQSVQDTAPRNRVESQGKTRSAVTSREASCCVHGPTDTTSFPVRQLHVEHRETPHSFPVMCGM
jgi:hypothetical protein